MAPGTLLVLRHRPVRPEPAVDYSTGWHVMLDALAIQLDGGDPAAAEPDFAALYESYEATAPQSGSSDRRDLLVGVPGDGHFDPRPAEPPRGGRCRGR